MVSSVPTRRFVPQQLDPAEWAQVEPLFDRLEARSIESPAGLVRWLLDQDELASCLSEYAARRYIDMTCHTDDPEIERRYLHWVEQIAPKLEPCWHRLKLRYLESPHRAGLDRRTYEVYDRHVQARVELFREENIPLQTELTTLDQQYDKLSGAMTVHFRGEEWTLPQMGRFQEEADRELRRVAWEGVAARRLEDRAAIESIFERMLELRQEVARNAGFEDYRAYAWKSRARFDYTPEDCLRFHDAVAEAVVPLRDRVDERRRQKLGVPTLRPWDLAVDPDGQPPLRPFETPERLCQGVETILGRLSSDFEQEFAGLRARGALDVESRKGKAPGGYQYTLDEIREPFIFMNAAGLQRDVETLLHEGGHALHAAATRALPLQLYRHAPFEFCEVASMAMEHLGRPHLDVFYNPEDARRAARKHLEDVVALVPWIAIVDSFQHGLYTHPGHSRDERREAWNRTLDRFYHKLDWTDWDTARDAMWHRQGHLFGSPFYYIEYAIAQMGALQIWLQAREDPERAIRNYRRALALGGSRPLPELFAAAEIRFDFSERTLVPLMEAVEQELEG
ncbi:MAG: M3 family oligoendopeptidase [Chloroflexi bacterium]|nr:M3 family oligoendopeptidase [Chloroflexota bacterium]